MTRWIGRAALAIVMALSAPPPAIAQAPDSYFRGKTIHIILGTGAGGAYGVYAQLFSKYFGKHIAGNPSVVAEFREGAGGVTAANYLYSVAPKDGTVIGIPLAPFVLAHYTDGAAARYDVSKFIWIGQIAGITRLFAVWQPSPIKTFDDLTTHETIAGSSGAGSETYMNPALMNYVFGTKIKIVSGYKGSEDLMLSLERGETTAVSGTWGNFTQNHPTWLKEGKIKPIVQIGLAKLPDFESVPLLSELAKNEADRQLVEFMSLVTTSIGYSVLTPPGVPNDIVVTLRHAFDETIKDPGFIADAQTLRADLLPADHTTLEDAVAKIAKSPPALFDRFAEAVRAH